MLEKVEKVTADVVVADRLKAWIISNNLKPGDRLPTEQKLSEELGVARHTLREGIKRLSQLGIIGSRTGSGMYVKNVSFDIFCEYMRYLKDIGYISFEDVCQVRRDLESSIAAVAALTITPEEITNLRKLVGKMADCCSCDDVDGYVSCDIEFHTQIADAARNNLYSGIVHSLHDVTVNFMSTLDRTTMARSNETHKEIVDALENRDSEAARMKSKEHLEWLRGGE